MTPSPLAAALAYAGKFGWPVFPTALVRQANGKLDKVPLVRWKGLTTPDLREIERWWRRWPNALISMPTGKRSGVVILDIDCKEDRWGFDTLDALGKSILPDTPIAHTVSSGVHVYFADNDRVEIRNSAGAKGLGVGLDIRGDGGVVVLPSPASGYWWDPHKNLDTVPLRAAPAWLGYRPPKPQRPSSGRGRFDPEAILDEACVNIRAAAAGERHDVLNREVFAVAGLVAAGALREHAAQHQLEGAALAMVVRTGGDRAKAQKDFAMAFADGLRRAWR